MRVASLLLGAILPLAFASPVAKTLVARDANSIVAGINQIESRIATLNSTLNTFGPEQLATALQIQGQTQDLGNAIQKTTAAANASQPLNSTDSFTVAIAVLNLEPQIFSLLDNIVAHKPAFQQVLPVLGDFSFLVKYDLQTQKENARELGNAIIAKLDPSYAQAGANVQQQISDAFDKAIAAFS